jgi:excisionase family DNA binding protein
MNNKKPIELLAVKDCAKLLGISLKSMWRIIHQRRLSVVRINRRVLISPDALMDFVSRHTVEKIDFKRLSDDILGS